MTRTLLFAGERAGGHALLHACDKATGADLWQGEMPGPQTSLPMTYVHQGRQFVVLSARGPQGVGAQRVAFALPLPQPAGGRGGRGGAGGRGGGAPAGRGGEGVQGRVP